MKAPQTVENTNGYRGIGRLFYIVRWSQHLPAIITEILILTSFAMSLIIFQPLAIQLLQQSLSLTFDQAVANLGVNVVFLTYACPAVEEQSAILLPASSELAAATAKKHREALKMLAVKEAAYDKQ